MIDGWTALAESTGRLPGLALNLAQLQQQGQHMRALEADSKQRLVTEGQRFGMEKERMETENATAKLALGEAQKKQQFLDSGWEPAVDPGIRALPEKDRQGFIDTINTMGIPKTQRGRLQAEQILESTSKLFKSYTDSLFQGKYDAYQQVEQEYNAALEKGDPEKIAVLKQKFDAAETEVNRSRGEIDKGIKIVAMNEAWNKMSPDFKTKHPELTPLYVNGQRTGDTKPFTDALEEIGKRVAAVPVIKSVNRGNVVDIYENNVKVRTEQKGVSPGTAPGEKLTSADKKRLIDLVNTATNSGKDEPTGNDVTIIKDMADKLGYDFIKSTTTTPGTLWGTNEKSEWKLVPKGGGGAIPPKFTAVNAKGLRIFSNDGVTWTEANGKVIK